MGKKCKHNSFWDIYKAINFGSAFKNKKGAQFMCSMCGTRCKVKYKGYKKMKKHPLARFFIYFLWLLPALILMYLVYTTKMYYMDAILWVILYHFISMVFIINSKRLKVSEV